MRTTLRRLMWPLLCALAIFVALVIVPVVAQADTENCVSVGEYDNTQYGASPLEVANRYDVYGQFIGDSDFRFRRAYRSCWATGERQVVVAYSYDTNGAVNWFTRDAE